jgi:hypothetical protein
MNSENLKDNPDDDPLENKDTKWTINQMEHLLDVYHNQLNANI